MLHEELSHEIVQAFYAVHRGLGPGLLEGCYHKALFLELNDRGLSTVSQAPFTVLYKKTEVGTYYADLLVEGKVLIEVKAVSGFTAVHSAQVINYLRVSGIQLGYLVNFAGYALAYRRLVLTA